MICLLLGWIFNDFHACGIGFQLFSYVWDGFSLVFILLGWICNGRTQHGVPQLLHALLHALLPTPSQFPTGVWCGQLVHFLDALAGTLAAPQALREPRQCAGALLGWISLSLGWIFNDFHDLGMDFQ